jgi:hypothetical protein
MERLLPTLQSRQMRRDTLRARAEWPELLILVLGMSKTAPALQPIISDYLQRSSIEVRAKHEVDNLGMAISLVASIRGVTLLPAYARNFLPWSVTSSPLEGKNDRSGGRIPDRE